MTSAMLQKKPVEISTATVNVKTLRVSGKQVTLAVFRQIRSASIVDEDGLLRGNLWGTVNYHTKDCGYDEHWHVVWQLGEELRQCEVSRTVPHHCRTGGVLAAREETYDKALVYANARSRAGMLPGATLRDDGWYITEATNGVWAAIGCKGRGMRLDMDGVWEHPGVVTREGIWVVVGDKAPPLKDHVKGSDGKCSAYCEACSAENSIGPGGVDIEEALRGMIHSMGNLNVAVSRKAAVEKSWQESLARVFDLDQLFIAV